MSTWIEVIPAYGRDYKTQAEIKADWNAGKDFRETASGSYISKPEAERLGLKVNGRYSKQMKVVTLRG